MSTTPEETESLRLVPLSEEQIATVRAVLQTTVDDLEEGKASARSTMSITLGDIQTLVLAAILGIAVSENNILDSQP